MENRDTFLTQLKESMVVAARDAKYRRNAPSRQKENESSVKRINFAVLWSALLTVLFMFAPQPITADTGRVYEVTLRRASRSGSDIHLDFGYNDHFEVSYTVQTAPLLEDSMQGRDFTVQATHHSGRRVRDRYEIIALTGADGVVYRTWEESESLREDNVPETLLTCLCLWALPFLCRTEPAGKGRKK